MNIPLHICIVGAGPGGLCLAQGLKKNGISFEVHEKDTAPDSRNQGYRLRIDETGQAALASCLPAPLYDLFQRTCALPSAQVNTLNPQLETLAGKWVKDWRHDRADSAPDLKADRLNMREVLLSGVQEHVRFGSNLTSYSEQADGKILARFADGSSSHADILVAADGVNSRVRELRFPSLAPQDTDSVCIYGKTVFSSEARQQVAEQLQTGTSVIFASEIAVIIDTMLFRDSAHTARAGLSPACDYIYWAVIGKRSSFDLHSGQALPATPAAIRACLEQTSAPWAAGLKAVFRQAQPEAMTMLPVRVASDMPVWSTHCITALGDASHAMSPASGLGANSALYDAAALTLAIHQIHSGASTPENAVRNYESKVHGHSFTALQASQDGSRQLFGGKEK